MARVLIMLLQYRRYNNISLAVLGEGKSEQELIVTCVLGSKVKNSVWLKLPLKTLKLPVKYSFVYITLYSNSYIY